MCWKKVFRCQEWIIFNQNSVVKSRLVLYDLCQDSQTSVCILQEWTFGRKINIWKQWKYILRSVWYCDRYVQGWTNLYWDKLFLFMLPILVISGISSNRCWIKHKMPVVQIFVFYVVFYSELNTGLWNFTHILHNFPTFLGIWVIDENV